MPAPTKNDWNSFHVESFNNKVNVLFYYLCQGGYNMQEIAEHVLRDYNPHGAQRVSLITRCYGFGGSNGGAFRSIGATKEDVAAFVRAYPNGCEYDGKGQVMKAFLQKRVQTRNKSTSSSSTNKKTGDMQRNSSLWSEYSPSEEKTTYPWDSWPQDSGEDDTSNYYGGYEPNRGYSSNKIRNILRIVVIIVIFCVCKFFLNWNWIVSIILAIAVLPLGKILLTKLFGR